jgi:cytochrome c-type biogenesis protein CcmH/NrfG
LQQFIQSLQRGTKQQPQNKPVLAECLNQLGQLYLRSKRTNLALTAFSNAIDLDPNSDEAYLLRAQSRLYGSDPNIPTALEDLATATQLNPGNVLAWFYLAELRFGLGGNNVSFAKDAYSTVIRLDPDFLEAYVGRIKCHTTLNAKRYEKQIQSDEAMIRQLRQ